MFSFCFISYISGSIIGHLGGNPFYYTVYSKSWTRDTGILVGPETRDLVPLSYMESKRSARGPNS